MGTRTESSRLNSNALLAGKLYDDRGNRMSPSHATKGGRRWRYYVSQAVLQGRKHDAGSVARVPAAEIEGKVAEAVPAVMLQPACSQGRSNARSQGSLLNLNGATSGSFTARTISSASDKPDRDENLRSAIERVTISPTTIEIRLTEAVSGEHDDRTLIIPWTRPSPHRRREIIQGDGEQSPALRPMRTKARLVVIEGLRDAHRWMDELMRYSRETIESLAAREGKTERSIRLTLSLAFVAPPLIKAAIEGRLPRGFGVKRLMDLPMAWSEQWTALGLKAPSSA